ncbi:FNBP1 [Lepeophtheirus salmonis]|uniref:FNBP1 n=1 Tax=Lepeophtheirus salmonis TaxID=72036 RepID=A0A7R8D4G3_LEPSM|nr:FNBP1 [Lepeophtheirus salmonis]CAF3025797.1 FNBP1 [Lepeophtheirus salmonis]
MNWGTELWDQYENIASHTQKGIDFLEKYGHFIDQRCKIEVEYASKLRRLIKTYLPKKKEEEDYQFTCTKAYKKLLNELGDQAGQHELIAENLSSSVAQELITLVKQLKDDRRKYLVEGARIGAQLQSSLALLAKTKEKYEKAFGASERALETYRKIDNDLTLSRAEVEKHRIAATTKNQQCEEAKNEYANQLQKTNNLQNKYYNQLLPAVFQNLQDLDERRIKCIQNFINKTVHTEQDVIPIISQCLEEMLKCADSINEKEDSCLVIERYKSGFSPPGDHPFEDLSSNSSTSSSSHNNSHDSSSVNGSNTSIQNQSEKRTILGTITGGRVKKRSGILGLFTNNKSIHRIKEGKKLQAKIDDITTKVCQETAARDGLMKMKQVYEGNPALGDPMSIQGQLTENGHRLDKLRAELKKYQTFLDELTITRIPNSPAGTTLTAVRNSNTRGVVPRRSSISDETESLSRSASDSSVTNPTQNHNKNSNLTTPLHSHGSSNSPESGMSSMSLPSSDQGSSTARVDDDDDDDDDSEFLDPEPLPPIGRCRAVYAFVVTSEGSIPMEENEDFLVIEQDQGDGWTRVRRTNLTQMDSLPEGFVPSSYINIYEMFDDPYPI